LQNKKEEDYNLKNNIKWTL